MCGWKFSTKYGCCLGVVYLQNAVHVLKKLDAKSCILLFSGGWKWNRWIHIGCLLETILRRMAFKSVLSGAVTIVLNGEQTFFITPVVIPMRFVAVQFPAIQVVVDVDSCTEKCALRLQYWWWESGGYPLTANPPTRNQCFTRWWIQIFVFGPMYLGKSLHFLSVISVFLTKMCGLISSTK